MKMKLTIAMVCAAVCAFAHRLLQHDTVVLANTDAANPPPGNQLPPLDPPARQQQQQQNTSPKRSEAEAELARRDKNERIIKKKMAAGLSREQAEAAVSHQEKFTARWQEVRSAQE